MGNLRFKLSEMLPNAWFYKLNHTSTRKTRKLQHKSSKKNVQSKTKSSPFSAAPKHTCHLRKPSYFNADFKLTSLLSEPPGNSSNRRRCTNKTIANSSVSNDYPSFYSKPNHTSELVHNYSTDSSSCADPVFFDLDSEFKRVKVDSPSNHFDCRIDNNTSINNNNHQKVGKCSKFDSVLQLQLKPIITKIDRGDHGTKPAIEFQGSSMKFEEKSLCSLKNDEIGEEETCPVRKLRVNSVGVKLRTNPPSIASKRLTQVQGRSHSLLTSVAIAKDSIDPDKDFKESMLEMIMEHNMSTKEEFEQLLACYLSLNSATYHELIVKVFEQIWFEITGN